MIKVSSLTAVFLENWRKVPFQRAQQVPQSKMIIIFSAVLIFFRPTTEKEI